MHAGRVQRGLGQNRVVQLLRGLLRGQLLQSQPLQLVAGHRGFQVAPEVVAERVVLARAPVIQWRCHPNCCCSSCSSCSPETVNDFTSASCFVHVTWMEVCAGKTRLQLCVCGYDAAR